MGKTLYQLIVIVEDRNSSNYDLNCQSGGKGSTQTNKTKGRKLEHSLTSRRIYCKAYTSDGTHTHPLTLLNGNIAATSYLEKLSHEKIHL